MPNSLRSVSRLTLALALALAAVALTALPLAAQSHSRIVGRVLDAASGAPIPGAQVSLLELPAFTAVSAIDGRFTLMNVPAGPVSLRVRMIGYQAKVVAGLAVPGTGIVTQDVALAAQVVEVEALTVTAGPSAGSVNAALEEQRSAVNVVNAVTAEQIAKSPDSDAGQAVQRVSGVSVQDGKFVFVRGLGERYTTTALNGARVPSPEPDRKVVPLDLFPSNLLEGVTTSKTFTPDQPGDFSGAAVNLKTREFAGGRVITLSSSGGMNGDIAGRSGALAPTVGQEWLGSAGAARALPGAARTWARTLDDADAPAALSSFRQSWLPRQGNGAPNRSLGASLGGEDPVFGHLVGYIASFTYSNAEETRRNERRSFTIAADGVPGGETSLAQDVFSGATYRNSVLWGGMANLSTRIGVSTKLAFNNTFTRSGDNEAVGTSGLSEQYGPIAQTRLTYTMRTVRSNQVSGEHLFGLRHNLDWQVTSSGVRRYEPDRSDWSQDGTLNPDGTVTPTMWNGNANSAVRTFSDLHESGWDLAANYRYSLGDPQLGSWVKVGIDRRTADRTAVSQAFNILNVGLSDSAKAGTPGQIFSDANIAGGNFFLGTDNSVGDYSATDRITAGYAMVAVRLSNSVRLITGARVENADLTVTTTLPLQAPVTTPRSNFDVLPSVALNFSLNADQNLRFSASQTLSRPEYRELSGASYHEMLGGHTVHGNPDLVRALIQNADARWEWYPAAGEILSFGVFYKHFDHPIEKVPVATVGSNEISFINAISGRSYGAELELRKDLGMFGDALRPFSVFSNVTLMNSRVRLDPNKAGATNSNSRPMLGQAPYVVNAGLGWNQGSWSATLLYNIVGRRVVEGGTTLLPDAYDEARSVVDASLRFPIFSRFEGKVDAKNLLDSEYRTSQGVFPTGGENDVLRYTTGRVFQVGMTYRP